MKKNDEYKKILAEDLIRPLTWKEQIRLWWKSLKG